MTTIYRKVEEIFKCYAYLCKILPNVHTGTLTIDGFKRNLLKDIQGGWIQKKTMLYYDIPNSIEKYNKQAKFHNLAYINPIRNNIRNYERIIKKYHYKIQRLLKELCPLVIMFFKRNGKTYQAEFGRKTGISKRLC